MDHDRFDDLTRSLARATSRRSVARGLLGVAAGGLVASTTRREAGAAPRGARCTSNADCDVCLVCQPLPGRNEGRCVATAEGAPCRGCGSCQNGRCSPDDARCPSGCGGCRAGGQCAPFNPNCYQGAVDDDHCPGCDPSSLTCLPPAKCGPCEVCVQNVFPPCRYSASGRDNQCDPERRPCDPATGQCRCRSDQIYCNDECVDPQTDRKHCGGCDKPCDACEICKDGVCQGCDTCQRCDQEKGECVSDCGSPCLSCEDGKCVDNHACVCQATVTRARAWAGLPIVGRFAGLAQTTEEIHCGPCEECDPDAGCKPVACDGPCEECDPADGTCKAVCPPEQCCDNGCVECPEGKILRQSDCQCVCPDDRETCGDTCCPVGEHCCNGVCKTSCAGQIYCRCNKTCYASATDCTANCRAGLGCFTDICRPANAGEC